MDRSESIRAEGRIETMTLFIFLHFVGFREEQDDANDARDSRNASKAGNNIHPDFALFVHCALLERKPNEQSCHNGQNKNDKCKKQMCFLTDSFPV